MTRSFGALAIVLSLVACSSAPSSPADAATDASHVTCEYTAFDGTHASCPGDLMTECPPIDACNRCRCDSVGRLECTMLGCPPGDAGVPDAASIDAAAMDASDAGATYTSWTECGWDGDGGACFCAGFADCSAVAVGVSEALGSHEVRVCGRHGATCDVAFFREVEGGGEAYRCEVQGTGACTPIDEARDCVGVFGCNLLMGTCPASVMPTSVIACSDVFPP